MLVKSSIQVDKTLSIWLINPSGWYECVAYVKLGQAVVDEDHVTKYKLCVCGNAWKLQGEPVHNHVQFVGVNAHPCRQKLSIRYK